MNLTTRLSCIAWALAAIQLSGCVTVGQADQVSPARDAQLSYSPAPSTVVVRERGVIKVKPDIASVSIRFEIEKPTLAGIRHDRAESIHPRLEHDPLQVEQSTD